MLILAENEINSQVHINGHMLVFMAAMLEYLHILVVIQIIRVCMIIPTDRAIISQVNCNGEDYYSRQLFWSMLKHYIRYREKGVCMVIVT